MSTSSLKQFFAFRWSKVWILLAVLVASAVIPRTEKVCTVAPGGVSCGRTSEPVFGVGYPKFAGMFFSGDAGSDHFFFLLFFLNVVLWYTMASLLLFLINRWRNNKGKVPRS